MLNFGVINNEVKYVFDGGKIIPMDYFLMEIGLVRKEFKIKKAEIALGRLLSEDNHFIRVRAEPEWVGGFCERTIFFKGQRYTVMSGGKSSFFIPEKCLEPSVCKEQENSYNNFIGTMAEIFSKIAGKY